MKYCINCVMPDTKPDLLFDANWVCNACNNFLNRTTVDWKKRKSEFLEIMEKYRSKDGTNWDCIIPVSWGKDSTYQVLKILSLWLNPLCVTSTTCDLSEIGRKNIENIKNLWVDYLEFTTNPVIRKKLNRIWLLKVGDISWPEHLGIFTVPIRVAVQYKIPMIIWWENSQNEYGWPGASVENNVLTRGWLEEFGWLLWMRTTDLIWTEGIEQKELIPFIYPSDDDLKQVGVTWLFLWYYFPWDGYRNVLLSQWFGFTTYSKTIEGSIVNYENLDNHQTWIHDYFKFIKFGFWRWSDLASLHIRRWRLDRDEWIQLVNRHDGKFPWTYLGKPIEDILKPLDITVDEFIKICDKFTNKRIFKTDVNGNLVKDKDGNLIKLYPISSI